MSVRRPPPPVPEESPRLLLAVRRTKAVEAAIADRLPDVPSVFLGESEPSAWSNVDAVLLGSIAREAKEWSPRTTPRLRFVQRVFTGVDDLPFEEYPPGVAIAGNVGGYAPFVAEHAVTLALAAARSIVSANAQVAEGRLRPPPQNRSLFGRSVAILGFGEIGSGIAARLQGFGVRVLGVNRTGAPRSGCDEMFPASRLTEAVARAAVTFDARPLTRATRGSLGAAVLAAMPADAILVNVGRAGTIDEAALFQHLTTHPEFRAALDVWWGEGFGDGRLHQRFPFPTLANVVGTPHCAAFAPGVEAYAAQKAVENLARYFAGEPPRYRVDRSDYEGLHPPGERPGTTPGPIESSDGRRA